MLCPHTLKAPHCQNSLCSTATCAILKASVLMAHGLVKVSFWLKLLCKTYSEPCYTIASSMEICIITTVKRVTKKMATIMDEQSHWHHSSQHTGAIGAWAPATHCQQCRTSSSPLDCNMPVFKTLRRIAQLNKKCYATTSMQI